MGAGCLSGREWVRNWSHRASRALLSNSFLRSRIASSIRASILSHAGNGSQIAYFLQSVCVHTLLCERTPHVRTLHSGNALSVFFSVGYNFIAPSLVSQPLQDPKARERDESEYTAEEVMPHWSIRLSRAALSKAPLPTFPIFSSHTNLRANFEVCEYHRAGIGPKLVTYLTLHGECFFVLLNHGRLVISRFQVLRELFEVFGEHIRSFVKRWNWQGASVRNIHRTELCTNF